ncbi:hypothetical protein [Salipiger thiooxidans]|uniref:hypothetical protein n=1 Tax=Salipiger thiooxidans TaxID=282683 RepID=UPI001CF9A794|nr:hypothetical protein [Salipiger thiooxidans]
MNHDERKVLIARELSEYLSPLAPPRALDAEAQAEMLRRTVAAINSRLPIGNADEVSGSLERMFEQVTRTHKGWAWPTPDEFVSAIRGGSSKSAPETFAPSSYDDASAEDMNAGRAVPEAIVWGITGVRLANSGSIRHDTLERYRKASARAAVAAWGEQGARAHLIGKYGEIAAAFFGMKAAE